MDRAAATDPSRGEGVSPFIAFGIAIVLVVGLAGAWMLARPDSPPTGIELRIPDAVSGPTTSLTDEEAIARFKELDALRIRAVEKRDLSLVDQTLTDDSPLIKLATKDIKKLADRNVLVETNFDTRWLRVISNETDTIIIRQGVYEAPTFRSEDGDKLRSSQPQFRVIDWTIHLSGTEWKIFDSEIIRSR
jgi:hypothetical protein